MYNFEDASFDELMNQDSAVLEAMERVDRGLFDQPEGRDEDVESMYEH